MPCLNHPLADAGLAECWVCGQTFCPECLAELQGHAMCAPCKAEAVSRLEQGESADAAEGEKAPWERIRELGIFAAFTKTIGAVISGPAAFFERLDKRVTTYACLGIPMITQTIVAAAAWLFSVAIMGVGEVASRRSSPIDAFLAPGVMGGLQVVFAPVSALIGVFLYAAFTHLVLVIGKNAKQPYHQTMRGYCYANAVNIVGIVPIAGPLVGFVWFIVVSIFMTMKVHRVSGGVATLAVLAIPLLLACCLAIVMIGAFGMLAARR